MAEESKKTFSLRKLPMFAPKIILIGASTGGPKALREFLTIIANIPQPILITQHVSANFTDLLATQLSNVTINPVKTAGNFMEIEPKTVYLAPGNHHLIVKSGAEEVPINPLKTIPENPYLMLTQEPPENFCRPSVDVMFRSAAKVYGNQALAIMLTGMGNDGINGSRDLVEAGSCLLAQDEGSSVVWGMPGAVSMAGLCSAVLPLNELAKLTLNMCMNPLQTTRKFKERGGSS